jgi:hypothetical protein
VLERYVLAQTPEDLWHGAVNPKHNQLLPDFLRRVMLQKTQLTEPKQVAWLLASYAREARARAEEHNLPVFRNVKLALEESLGIKFEGDKGEHFFRSTLVQTLFYGIFSAWVLWRHSPHGRARDARFNWRLSDEFLKVPILRKLFREVSDTAYLNSIQLTEILELAGDALNRVQPTLFDIFRGEEAVAYFYEPFLEAFDPELRKELGVWYTPREIVHYMVERVDQLLRTELNQPLGLASTAVRILDPCCGTGAYLTSVLNRIHRTLKEQAGDDPAYVASDLRTAALTRVFGFEIMPAPFVIAHMEIARLLEDAGASLTDRQRAGVFLTNALTGWVPVRHPQAVMYPELEQEREDSELIKQHGTILVILGNPPYNGYAGIAKIEEERDLTNAYRAPVAGLPAPQGQGLNDLYIRFFRIAERRIAANADGQGIVSFISNNAWLDGLSHTTMRHHYLHTFQQIFIDNLNGDKYRTGKTTPDGKPDPSAFSTPQNREGIQVGTAISTLVRNTAASETTVHLRDLWGTTKLSQLETESRREAEPIYANLDQAPALGNPFAHRIHSAAYTSWPRLPDLFPVSYPGIKTSRDPLVVDIDRDRLVERMTTYLDNDKSDEEIAILSPVAMTDATRFNARQTRARLTREREFDTRVAQENSPDLPIDQLQRDLTLAKTKPYLYRPFDRRWIFLEPYTKLLDEKREEYQAAHIGSLSVISAQSNRKAFDPPCLTKNLASLHVVEKGSTIFPSAYWVEKLPGTRDILENISEKAMGICDGDAEPEEVFHHAVAIMHTPQYRTENSGALLGDWPRIPLPATAELLHQSVTLGRRLSELLDPESSINLSAEWSFLAALKRGQHTPTEEALKITASWGRHGQGSTVMPGPGKLTQREWTSEEREKLAILEAANSLTLHQSIALLGKSCVDVYLNNESFWSAVPINVWNYTLGGYQVLKKWLSYRELPLLGRPLHEDESRYFAQVVRRIAAILLLGPALDASYQAILPTATGLPGVPISPDTHQ